MTECVTDAEADGAGITRYRRELEFDAKYVLNPDSYVMVCINANQGRYMYQKKCTTGDMADFSGTGGRMRKTSTRNKNRG